MNNPFLNTAFSDVVHGLREFSTNSIVVDGESYKVVDPVTTIPNCMLALDLVESVIEDICTAFDMVTPNHAAGIFGNIVDIPMNDSINQWLDKIREELSKLYGAAMLDTETWALSNGIDIEGTA